MPGQSDTVGAKSLNESDEAIIKNAIAKFGDREAASRALAVQGWMAIKESRVELASERFNESRLLNPKNYQAYWGIGAILSEQGKLSEAIEQLELARELIEDLNERVSLLSDLGALYSQYATRLPKERELERARAFVAANQRFTESLENDPDHARSWREWAISLYRQERLSEAWIKAQRAIELEAEPFPADFLDRLKRKTSNGD
jgi:tetratricopeptide (TPR) repeat protein